MLTVRNPLKRFLFRKDFFRRVKKGIAGYNRKILKSEIRDLELLFSSNSPHVIFDVGANIGNVTNEFLSSFKSAKIYAFEPDPIPFSKLSKSYQLNNRVHIYQLAASDLEGKLDFVQRPRQRRQDPGEQWRVRNRPPPAIRCVRCAHPRSAATGPGPDRPAGR